MTYEQAMSNNTITAYEAMREIIKHGLEFDDFVSEYGENETYYSKDVMIWLGY